MCFSRIGVSFVSLERSGVSGHNECVFTALECALTALDARDSADASSSFSCRSKSVNEGGFKGSAGTGSVNRGAPDTLRKISVIAVVIWRIDIATLFKISSVCWMR